MEVTIDIGSHSLKGIIFERPLKNAGLPKILNKKVVPLPVFSEPSETETDILNRPLVKLQKFSLDLVNQTGHPTKITFGFGPNLASLSIKEWGVEIRGFPKNLSAAEVHGYLENLKKQNLGQNQNTLVFPLETKLNGYILKSFNIRKPKNAELEFRVMLAELREPVKKIFSDLTKILGGTEIEFIPLILPELSALKSLGIHNAFGLDVGGEETVIFLLKDDMLRQIKFFPLAGRHFIRGIAKTASISFAEAEDFKRQHIQGLADLGHRNQVHDFLKQEAASWGKNLLDNLEHFYHVGPIPVQVLVFGGGANLPEILSVIRAGNWLKNYSYAEFPKVNVLRGDAVFSGDSLGGFIQGPDDFSLASLLGYNRI